jgi:hypothetical protein
MTIRPRGVCFDTLNFVPGMSRASPRAAQQLLIGLRALANRVQRRPSSSVVSEVVTSHDHLPTLLTRGFRAVSRVCIELLDGRDGIAKW